MEALCSAAGISTVTIVTIATHIFATITIAIIAVTIVAIYAFRDEIKVWGNASRPETIEPLVDETN